MKAYLKKAVLAVALVAGAVFGAAVGFGGNVPLLPSTATFSEPSQVLNTINTWAQSLNGTSNAITPTPVNMGLGAYCSNGAGGATPQVCNGSRGAVTFTGVTVAADAAVTVTITNSLVNTGSNCVGGIQNNPTGASSPFVSSITNTAGSMAVVLGNPGTTTGSVTLTIGFTCFN